MYPEFSTIVLNDVDSFIQAQTNNLNKNSNRNESDSSEYKIVNEINSPENNYGDIRLDLEPDHYPKKFRKFVNELITLLNCVMVSNVSKIILRKSSINILGND